MRNNRNNNIRYFNAHLEAFGYINGIREVAPSPSGAQFDPFWATTFCMLEGDPQNPFKKYFNANIVNKKVLEVLLAFESELNSGAVTVFANVRLAKIDADPFVYDDDSKTPGQLGINWSARIISLIYLKVGDHVIDFNLNDKSTAAIGVDANQKSRGQVAHLSNQRPFSNQHDSVSVRSNPSNGNPKNARTISQNNWQEKSDQASQYRNGNQAVHPSAKPSRQNQRASRY